MAQAVFDFTERFTGQEHTNSTGVPEAVSRVDVPETFGTQRITKIFFTNTIDAVPCK